MLLSMSEFWIQYSFHLYCLVLTHNDLQFYWSFRSQLKNHILKNDFSWVHEADKDSQSDTLTTSEFPDFTVCVTIVINQLCNSLFIICLHSKTGSSTRAQSLWFTAASWHIVGTFPILVKWKKKRLLFSSWLDLLGCILFLKMTKNIG